MLAARGGADGYAGVCLKPSWSVAGSVDEQERVCEEGGGVTEGSTGEWPGCLPVTGRGSPRPRE